LFCTLLLEGVEKGVAAAGERVRGGVGSWSDVYYNRFGRYT
jgi:hypothetical protein